jgi:DNA-binding protein HU-beta
MNKAELIDVLTKKLDTDRRTATEAVENVVDTIVRAVHKGESVTITGFGVFEQRRRAARVARNPRTGETVKVKPTSVPAFRPGAQFKAVVSGAQRLSAEGPAVKRGSGTGTARKAAKKSAAKKAVKRSPAKKAATKRTAAKKATKRSPAKKAATKRTAAKKATKRTPAKKATATKRTAAKKATKRSPAKKATKRAAAKKTAKRSPAKKAVRRSPAKKGRR